MKMPGSESGQACQCALHHAPRPTSALAGLQKQLAPRIFAERMSTGSGASADATAFFTDDVSVKYNSSDAPDQPPRILL